MKKLFVFLVLAVFLVSFASAASVSYSDNDMTAHIKDTILFGLINVGEQGTMTLASHKSVTEVLEVGLGWQVNMYYDTNFGKLQQDILGEVTFVDMKTGEEIEKEYKYVYWGEEEYESNKYTCLDETNEECVISGVEIKTREKWLDYNSKDIPKGQIRIGIMVNNKQGDYIDGIWEIQGKKIKKHASWTAGLSVNQIMQYEFEENNANTIVADSFGSYTGVASTNTNNLHNTSGKINSAFDFDGGSEYIDTNILVNSVIGSSDSSISLWVNANVLSLTPGIWQLGDGTTTGNAIRMEFRNGNFGVFRGGHVQSSFTPSTGQWYHVVLIRTSGNGKMYVNGNPTPVMDDNNVLWDEADFTDLFIGSANGSVDFYNGRLDEFSLWDRAITTAEIEQIYNSGSGIEFADFFPPIIILNSPVDTYTQTNLSDIVFNSTVTDSEELISVKLWIDGTLNETNSSGVNGIYIFTKSLGNGDHTWLIQATDNDSYVTNSSTRTLTIDSIIPTIDLVSPNETFDYMYPNYSLTLNFTATDTNLDTCWYNYNETNNTIECTTGVLNSSAFNYQKDKDNLTIYVNDTLGNENSKEISWRYRVFKNNRTLNTSSYETKQETFKIDLTANSSLTAVVLDYNGTEYVTTKSGSIYSKTFDIPLGVQNRSVRWKFTYGGDTLYSDYSYQNILETVFTHCNATYTDDFLNITFKDEALLTYINASIPTSTFTYYLGDGSVNKSYTYINTSNHYNYTFCATPDLELNVMPYVQFKQGTDYPQRIWQTDAKAYTSTMVEEILYLLSSIDGQYVTFQVINTADQVISGVSITANRTISGTDTTVGKGTTGADGTVTFWLNPDFVHDFSFIKSGFTTYETSYAPTQTSYTITLAGGTTTVYDYTKGMAYSILPTNSSLLNDTSYTFGFNLTSSFWDLDSYGFNLRLNNGTIIAGDSTTSSGTQLTNSYDVNNQSRIYLDYYWLVSGNYTNGTREWIVFNDQYTSWSIKTFFDDLNTYLDSGMFGIDDFGRYLLIFLLLFLTVGVLGYKYGFNNPIFVTGLIFFVVFFFDVAIGIIPTIKVLNGNEVPYILTFVSGLIFAINVIKEVNR